MKKILLVSLVVIRLGAMESFLNNLPVCLEGRWELDAMEIVNYVKDTINPRSMMEIGFNNGFSASLWMFTLKNLNRFVSVDIGRWDYTLTAAYIVGRKFTDKFQFIMMDSKKLHDLSFKENFDLVFIDGDHSYEGCMSDLNYAKHVAPYIILDDVNSAEGVWVSAGELVAKGEIEKIKHWNIGWGVTLYKSLVFKGK